MKTLSHPRTAALALMLALAGSFAATGALAQERDHRREPPRGRPGPAAPFVLDHRYGHDHYYPPVGYAVGALPTGAVSVGFGGGHWFFHGGVWFRAAGGRFVVGLPPVGIAVPLLPPGFVTLWIGGANYYYANGVYYSAAADGGYTVVDAPPGAGMAKAAPPPAPAQEPVIYPRNGQTAAQTDSDRKACNEWAAQQPGALADSAVFQRGVSACMDARGYTVR